MSKWISVDLDLPDEDCMVIVASDDDVFASHFRCGHVHGDFWFDVELLRGIKVTHWQPLPSPPEGE